ncbi:MAG: polyprenyl synthetase family protein [Campylobacterota bacterium]|nr:polyprenyl synthetase family protein [Campylobacterota bacterium]
MSERVEKAIIELVEEVGYDEVPKLFKTLKGGKRLRARLVQKIAHDHEDAPLLGAIIELIHAASLLHDDVIDDASLRRGVPSVNATEGSKTAIMLGDILYSKGFSSLVSFDKAIAQTVADAVTALSVGEMMDVRMAESFNDDEAQYLHMLYLKTASLIEASAKSAALLAGKDAERYAVYGKNLGLAFQIIDDILDIVSDEATLGKPAMNDFVEGKCTLPYIYLYEALSGAEKEKLKSFHAKVLDGDDTAWVKAKMKEHQTVERSYMLAGKLSQEAMAAVSDEPELVAIIEAMMERSY